MGVLLAAALAAGQRGPGSHFHRRPVQRRVAVEPAAGEPLRPAALGVEVGELARDRRRASPGKTWSSIQVWIATPPSAVASDAQRACLLRVVDQRRGADQPVAAGRRRPRRRSGCGGCGRRSPRSRAATRSSSASSCVAALGAGQRLVGDDDHPALAGAGELAAPASPAGRSGRGRPSRRRVATRSSTSSAQRGRRRRRVVEQRHRRRRWRRGRPRAAPPPHRRQLATRGVGGHADRRPAERLGEEAVDERRAAAGRRASTAPLVATGRRAASVSPGGRSHSARSPTASDAGLRGRDDLAGDERCRGRRAPGTTAPQARGWRTARSAALEQARVARGVEVGAVVERVGVERRLDAEVARRARCPGLTRPPRRTSARARARCPGRCRSGRRPGSPRRAQRADRVRRRRRAPARSASPGGGTSTGTAARGGRGT